MGQGSTVVTLKAAWLEALSVEQHSFSMVSGAGTRFTDVGQPLRTGDISHDALWLLLPVLSAGTLGTVVGFFKKKKRAN